MNSSKKKFLVTGGAGFIGSHLVDFLLAHHHQVCVIDDFNTFYDPAIKQGNIAAHLDNPDFCLYHCDITNQEELRHIFDQNAFDIIIHLAARAGVRPSLQEPLLYNLTNVAGTGNLLELAHVFSVKKFIFGSSSSVYGNSDQVPFREDFDISKPISPYAATKVSGEAMCYTYSYLYNIQAVCLRFFTVYGPRQRPDLAIHKFTKLLYTGQPIQMFGDGSTQRDYTYIDDILQGIIGAINYDKKPFDIFNLGESRTMSLAQLISMLEEYTKQKAIIKPMPLQPGDVHITYANIDKARTLLNYNPQYPLEIGLKEFVNWFQQHYSVHKAG